MYRVNNLYIGNLADCSFTDRSDWAIVHACMNPCHLLAVGYNGSAPKTHPEYLVCRRGSHLFLNVVDMDTPQQHQFMAPMIREAFAFITEMRTRNVLIHCNEGFSRAPSFALLYLAKVLHVLPTTSYQDAAGEFQKLYPLYHPRAGIATYLYQYWPIIPGG